MLFALLLGSSLHALAAESNPLPDLGSPSRATFSHQQEQVLSLAFLEAIYQQAPLLEDPELNSYLRTLGQRLLRHSPDKRRYQFFLIDDDSINAFAGPGGIIAFNTGLLLAAKSEDELIAVMAHEIAHVQQEHIARMFDQGKKGILPTVAGIVAALLIGSQNSQAAMAMMTGTLAYNAQQQLAFSRDHEHEADRIGIELMSQAGYDTQAMASFFETLANRYRADTRPPELLMTHPVTDKRIADSRARAKVKSTTQRPPASQLQLAQTRLRALKGLQPETTQASLTCYHSHLRHWLSAQGSPPACALPEHPWSQLLRLQTSGTPSDWRPLLDLHPNDPAIWQRLADQLLDRQQPDAIISLLEPRLQRLGEHWPLWQRLARAWHQKNQYAAEALTLAQAYASTGQLKLARIQINQAEKVAGELNNSQRHTLEDLRNWLDMEEKERSRQQ